MSIAENLRSVREKIDKAAKGREIILVCVTKRANVPQIKEAIDSGVRVIGENRVKDAIEKFFKLPIVEKHMIGHLQTNKVKHAVQHFDVIQSVDSLKLAKEIDKRSVAIGKVMPVMIEVNVSGEEQKHGIKPADANDFLNQLTKLINIKVIGLMTMAPFVVAEKTRPYFAKLRQINMQLKLPHLSMGTNGLYRSACT